MRISKIKIRILSIFATAKGRGYHLFEARAGYGNYYGTEQFETD